MTDESLWDYYQNEARHAFAENRPRLAYLLSRASPPGRLLNIGVGDGALEELALARGFTVFSLDPNERAVAALRQRLRLGDNARTGSAEQMPFPDESFDAVVISEVLEHFEGDAIERTLNEIHRVLAPAGRIIGSVPAAEDLSSQEVVCPECRHRFHRWGHRQSFSIESVVRHLESRFAVRTVVSRPFFTWSRLNWKGRLTAIARLALARLGSHGSNESICFVAVKH